MFPWSPCNPKTLACPPLKPAEDKRKGEKRFSFYQGVNKRRNVVSNWLENYWDERIRTGKGHIGREIIFCFPRGGAKIQFHETPPVAHYSACLPSQLKHLPTDCLFFLLSQPSRPVVFWCVAEGWRRRKWRGNWSEKISRNSTVNGIKLNFPCL